MSFGTSVGDIVKVGELAYRVWRACSSASPEFKELRRELGSIEITLRSLGDDADDPSSLICRRGAARQAEVMQIIDNLKLALIEVERLVMKYHSLGLMKKRTFDRLKFATHDLGDLRSKMSIHLAALTSFYNSLQTSSLARIEAVLEDIYQDIRNGDREPTIISMCNTPGDENAWDLLKKELAAEDVAVFEVEKHRAEIVSFLKELILKDPEAIEPSDSVSNDPLAQQLAFADLLITEKLRQNDFDVDNEDIKDAELESALLWACAKGHVDVVKFLLRQNVDLQACKADGTTALHNAVRAGHLNIVEDLIIAGADTTASRKCFPTGMGIQTISSNFVSYNVLMDAAEAGRTGLVKCLLNSGATTDPTLEDSVTALHLAVANNHHSTVCALLDAGADLTARSSHHEHRNAIYLAAELGYPLMVKYLIKRGADPGKSCEKRGPIISAVLDADIDLKCKESLCRFLLDAGASARPMVRQNDNPPVAPLQAAIRLKSIALVKLLMSRGADPNYVDSSGSSPLCTAIKIKAGCSEKMSMIEYLVDAGANVATSVCQVENMWISVQHTVNPLNTAIAFSDLATVIYLLSQGSSANFCGDTGTSPICHAIEKDIDNETQRSIVRHLIKAGASLDESKVENMVVPALHVAIKHGRLDLVAFLLSSGVQSELVDHTGTSPLCQAINLRNAHLRRYSFSGREDPHNASHGVSEETQLAIIRILLTNGGANINTTLYNKVQVRPLHRAIERGQAKVAELLIAKGADRVAKNSNGLGPILIAVQAHVKEESLISMISLLHKAGTSISERLQNSLLTPLHIAAGKGNAPLLKLLLQCGADPNALDYWKSNALHLAADAQSAECVSLLLAAGTNPRQISQLSDVSFYPLDVAVINEDSAIITLLDRLSPRTTYNATWDGFYQRKRIRTYAECRRTAQVRGFE